VFRDFSLVAKEPDMQEASSRLALMENAALKPLLNTLSNVKIEKCKNAKIIRKRFGDSKSFFYICSSKRIY
jgi:hypothetical protein